MGRLTICYGDIKGAGACSDRYLFATLFGKRRHVPVTFTTAIAYADRIDWEWGAVAFLDADHKDMFDSECAKWMDWPRTYVNPGTYTNEQLNAKRAEWRRHVALAFTKAFLEQGGIG